jgi:iron complex transport system substrate-binding protein
MFDPVTRSRPGLASAVTRRRLLAAVPALGLLPLGAVRTQTGTPESGATPAGAWSFTDDRGVTLSFPQQPTRIVGQTAAVAALWDYGVRPVGIFGPSRTADGSPDFQAGNIDLDTVEVLGDFGEMDLEKLVALKPDIYVDMALYGGQLWYLGESEEQVKAIVPTLGISMERVSILTSIERFEELAAALGADPNAPDVVEAKAAFAQAESDLKAAIAAKPGLKVLVVSPTADQVYVASPRYMTDLYYFHELGLDIVDHSTDDFFELISFEQVGNFPADLILLDARLTQEQLDDLAKVAVWDALPAVQAGQVGRWYAGAPYSHQRLTPILQELTGLIGNSKADLV